VNDHPSLQQHFELREQLATHEGEIQAKIVALEKDLAALRAQSDASRDALRKVTWIVIVTVLSLGLEYALKGGAG
jgi:hypothetical protein